MDDFYLDVIVDFSIGSGCGSLELFVLSGMVVCVIWHYDTDEYGEGGWVYEVDGAHDFNNDGIRDILAASGDDGSNSGPRRVQLFNGMTGSKIWEHAFYSSMTAVISLNDITGDSIPDVVCASSPDYTDGNIYVLDGSTGYILSEIDSNSMAVFIIFII